MPIQLYKSLFTIAPGVPTNCLVIDCNKPEVAPGFCAEHAAMVNAECDRLDNLRKRDNMSISLFTWLTHRWLIPPAILLLIPVINWYCIGFEAMLFTCIGIVAGIVIALFVRKWREMN